MSINCLPKFTCKVIKPKESRYKPTNKETANKVDAQGTETIKVVEFAGMASFQTPSSFSTPSCRYIQHHRHRCPANRPRRIHESLNIKTSG